jgi:CRP/FNR family transcriptional regulator, cyclic AMP receptor protein
MGMLPLPTRTSDRSDLNSPRGTGPRLGGRYDADAFGRVSEAAARFLGTGRYLVGQSLFVVVWLALNITGGIKHWDPYPFILLNLVLSMLAAIQAPVIMMSQNRTDAKDRVRSELDFQVNRRAESEIQALSRRVHALGDKLDDMDDRLRGSVRSS